MSHHESQPHLKDNDSLPSHYGLSTVAAAVVPLTSLEIWQAPGSNLNPLFEDMLTFASSDPADQLLGIKIRPDGVFREELARHELVGFLNGVEIVHLRLEHIPIGILIVDAGRGAVVDRPHRRDVPGPPLAVRQ